MLIDSCVMNDSFTATMTELSSYNREYIAYKPKIVTVWLLKKSLPTPVLYIGTWICTFIIWLM